MSLDLEAKKVLLRKIPHGLFICGVRDGDQINGFTASWITQGSFEPPLVVIAVRSDGSSHATIKKTGLFSVNILRKNQKDLAAIFFKPQKALGGRFESAPFVYGEHGLPILEDAIGGLECKLVGKVEHGDHTVFVAEVISATLHNDEDALNLASTGLTYGG